jgi:hypothetical protein
MIESLLEKRDPDEFNDKIQKVMNLLTISRDFVVIGSAGLKKTNYYSDIDLNELYERPTDNETILDNLLKDFQEKFKEAEKDPTIFITDLKCGMDSDGEPLRWDKSDIKRGWKILKDKRKIRFQDCVLMKTTFKMDVVALVNGSYTEISDNYFIKLGEYSNYFPFDFNKNKILNSIEHDYDEYFYASGNLYKGLKRAFAFWKLKDPEQYKIELSTLLHFFNSPVGLLYQNYSTIGTIIDLIDNTFRKPSVTDIKKNIKILLTNLQADYTDDIRVSLTSAVKASSLNKIKSHLENARNQLLLLINNYTAHFVLKNRNVAIY